jgi:uncharacterized membrane protein
MATIAFLYEVLALLAAALIFVAFLRGTQGVPVPPESRRNRRGRGGGLSVVLIIEPGDDAEHSVAAVLAQKYADFEVVIVACAGTRIDPSTAASIEADPRATLLEAGPPAAGWTRSNDAYIAGFRRTRHEHVLFMDANVLLRPDGLDRALGLARQRGIDLLTIFPSLTATSWIERLMIPFFLQLTFAGVSLRKINDPDSDAAGGFAPFFLFRREVYKAIGGHAAVRADRFSDSTLAQTVKNRGYRLLVADGTELAVLQGQNRLRDIWSSWAGSFNDAIGNNLKHAALLASLVLVLFAIPWFLVVLAVLAIAFSSETLASSPWLGVVIIGGANIMVGILHRRSLRTLLDIDDSLALMQPLAAVITAAMIVASSFHLEGTFFARLVSDAPAQRQPNPARR